MAKADSGLSRRQVLGGMAVGAAAAGAVIAGLATDADSTAVGITAAGESEIPQGPPVRPICAADWAAACWWTPSTAV